MAERPQGFARRMMAQQLMTDALGNEFSDSPFFAGKVRPSVADIEQPTTAADMYPTAATGSLFLPGAGVADVLGQAPDPARPGQTLPSFGQNIAEGKFLDAGLQTAGAAGDVLLAMSPIIPPAAAVGTALKAPRAAKVGRAVDAAQADPNQAAGAAMDAAQARYFETGNFEPPTAENPVSIVPPKPDEPGIIAFHGSGADFDEFRLEMIGTGEGAQAYGYGLYFADSEDIAKFYKDTVQFKQRMRGNTLNINYQGKPFKDLGDTAAAEAAPPSYTAIKSIADEMAAYLPANPKMAKPELAKERLLTRIDSEIEKYSKAGQPDADVGTIELQGGGTLEELLLADLQQRKQALLDINSDDIQPATGKMYKVGLAPKPDELLDYDAPISQQSEKIQNALKVLSDDGYSDFESGEKLMEFFRVNFGLSPQEVSEYLYQGTDGAIKGIKYRAAGSRGAATADEAAERNYVIFDDKAVKILEKYGIVGPVAVAAVAGTQRGDNDNQGSIFADAGGI